VNILNRILVCLFLLVFTVSALLVALLPKIVIENLRYALNVADLNLGSATQLIGAVLGLLVAVGAVLLLVAELRPSARQSVVVAQSATGTAELTTESVALRVKRVAESISGIREASPVIRSHGKSVGILLRLSTDPDVDLPQKTEEVMTAVRAETETKMGIPVKSLRVTVKHGSQGRSQGNTDQAGKGLDSFRG